MSGDDRDFVMLTLAAEYNGLLHARERAPVVIGVLVTMIAVMALELMPNAAAALLAALAIIPKAGAQVPDAAFYETRALSANLVVAVEETGPRLWAHGVLEEEDRF